MGCAHAHTDDINGQVWGRGKASFSDSPSKPLFTAFTTRVLQHLQGTQHREEPVQVCVSPELGLPMAQPRWVGDGPQKALPPLNQQHQGHFHQVAHSSQLPRESETSSPCGSVWMTVSFNPKSSSNSVPFG